MYVVPLESGHVTPDGIGAFDVDEVVEPVLVPERDPLVDVPSWILDDDDAKAMRLLVISLELVEDGVTVEAKVLASIFRYHLPISVSDPSAFNIVALAPTFETSLRNDPKYEYLST